MPADQATILESLVEQCRLPDSSNEHAPHARDITNYIITIDINGHIRRASLDDLNIPASLQPLLSFLKERAKPLPQR